MISVIQRVKASSLSIDNTAFSAIDQGILALVGMEKGDTEKHADKLLEKILAYRIFADDQGKMNLSVGEVNGGLMLVSQFTLAGDTNKGLRPSFSSAMPPAEASPLYDYMLQKAQQIHTPVAAGQFAADMQIELLNDGPVTFILRS